MYLQECVMERRVPTDQRWVEGVGASREKPGSNARVWRSLDADQHAHVKPAEREEPPFKLPERGELPLLLVEDCR
jgi:hypothetical protein